MNQMLSLVSWISKLWISRRLTLSESLPRQIYKPQKSAHLSLPGLKSKSKIQFRCVCEHSGILTGMPHHLPYILFCFKHTHTHLFSFVIWKNSELSLQHQGRQDEPWVGEGDWMLQQFEMWKSNPRWHLQQAWKCQHWCRIPAWEGLSYI